MTVPEYVWIVRYCKGTMKDRVYNDKVYFSQESAKRGFAYANRFRPGELEILKFRLVQEKMENEEDFG